MVTVQLLEPYIRLASAQTPAPAQITGIFFFLPRCEGHLLRNISYWLLMTVGQVGAFGSFRDSVVLIFSQADLRYDYWLAPALHRGVPKPAKCTCQRGYVGEITF